ncbi:LEA14-like dessication related protein [Chromobacterium alkanivorans]|uniref:LEA type 2 family protein n=1 Tax=Chromobacterium TaxID=535 RepID=UPI000652EC4B|nr:MULTISPECIES: LEA type 2 family protein [Chromobacterium]KMN76768.1 hypothetical protein VK98_19610 [Chromobacterium sp. LK11]MBN3004552.1 LEA type 2 family protein [Chromobacterium alkanivorans]MCS3805020.1 LEA14-like dessication related protein [Chromobacterium alkanivorans]MCS3819417.1 LEA14-like dessication related protein [Chromobacterium alkanivorans]MCS3873929.1 LEA14-like dessication related protein [Chromobacterium alkanivorans]
MKRYLGIALFALLLSGCAALNYQKPQVSIADVKPGRATLFEQSFDVSLRVSNPNNLALNAKGMTLELNVAGEKLATGVSNQAIAVPALGEGLITLQLHTSLAGWLKQIGKAMEAGNGGKLEYQLNGTLEDLNGMGRVPFRSKGEWKLPGQ